MSVRLQPQTTQHSIQFVWGADYNPAPMPQPPLSPPLEEIVAIVGIGLIGGSLAAALRQRKVARRVIGVGRDASRLEAARKAGLIDEGSTDLAEVARRANLIVFCTPVERVAEGVRAALAGLSSHSVLSTQYSALLITDAGSVKGPICSELADIPNFIGAHPIAGSHRQGFEAADANLFEGKVCVLTPPANADADRIQRLEQFWQSVGMKTVAMTPDDHDRALAMTSHLPHVVASSLSATLSPENHSLTGTGFRDTTRVAAGDPALWSGILLNNVSHVVAGIEDVQHRLESFRTALKLGNADVLKQLLEEGRTSRDALGP
ncbi:MAG: prephenate dehydrogenase/arogenate dehydrogenase family protein [Candidatus Saccharimonas sp.]|nr:prephenate dehydrogenase/arogenate dehydrogenase family protein [Planctomycetaceae bacterium]